MSETMSPTEGHCFSFWYHMFKPTSNLRSYLETTSHLRLYLETTSSHKHTLKVINGIHVNDWTLHEINIRSRDSFRLLIEAVHEGRGSVIGLDDVRVDPGVCGRTCSVIHPHKRVGCTNKTVSPLYCTRTLGCCYDESSVPTNENRVPCYRHPSSCLSVLMHERVECGYEGISSLGCQHEGCCFDEVLNKCYASALTPNPFPPSPTTPSHFDCNFEQSTCNFLTHPHILQSHWSRQHGGPIVDRTKETTEGEIVDKWVMVVVRGEGSNIIEMVTAIIFIMSIVHIVLSTLICVKRSHSFILSNVF